MHDVRKILKLWKSIFFNLKNSLLVFLVAIVFYVFNAFVSNYQNIWYSYKNSSFITAGYLSLNLISGFWSSISTLTLIYIIVIGVLTGILSMIIRHKINVFRKSKVGVASGLGIFLGVFAPSCAVCSIGLVGLLGLSAGLAFLPFQGKEIGILAMIMILFSIVKISYDTVRPDVCKM